MLFLRRFLVKLPYGLAHPFGKMGLMPGSERVDTEELTDDRLEIHQEVDISKPVIDPSMSALGDPSEIPFSWESGPVAESQEGLQPVANSEDGSPRVAKVALYANLDLSLKLSPPKPGPADEILIFQGPVNPSSEGLKSGEELCDIDSREIPALILKGCSRCYMFVMVPKTDQKCPSCGDDGLVGNSPGSPS